MAGLTVCSPSALMHRGSLACCLGPILVGRSRLASFPQIHMSDPVPQHMAMGPGQHLVYSLGATDHMFDLQQTTCSFFVWTVLPSLGFYETFVLFLCHHLLFVCSSSEGNVVSAFKPLKPIVACLKFICFFFPITAFNFFFMLVLSQSLNSPQLKFSDEKVSSQRVFLTFLGFLANHLSPVSCFSCTACISLVFVFRDFC